MIHDDDTSKRATFIIDGTKWSTPATKPAQMPPMEIQQEITRMAKIPGFGPERILATLGRTHAGIDLNTIRYILESST